MSENLKKKRTDKFQSGFLPDLGTIDPDVTFRPIPQKIGDDETGDRPIWRVRFDLATDHTRRFGLEINGEVILGRSIDAPNLVDLSGFNAGDLGVSRQHLMLQPTQSDLFVVDLGSTNGTMCNNETIEPDKKYALANGDSLTLGRLNFTVHIVKRPYSPTSLLGPRLHLEDALLQVAKSITSQLDLDEVLNQIAEMAMTLTSAGGTGIWLVDEFSGALFLEAERGMQDERVRRLRLPMNTDNLVSKVIRTGKSLRARRQPGEGQIKMKTNYLVEALVYVPITLRKATIGVLAAVHREPGKQFNERDERLLSAIADSAAIAIQNARLYEATDQKLDQRVQELSALTEVSRTVSASLDLNEVYAVLVEQVNKYWPVETVQLWLLDDREKILRLLTTNTDSNGKMAPLNQGLIGGAAADGTAVLCNDVQSRPEFDITVDGLDGRSPQSLACIPLRSNRVVGVLALFNNANGPFTDEDLHRLEAFANPIAAAIENARLFAEASRQRAAIQATAQALSQPLIILDEHGEVLISNQAANTILETHMPSLFEAISSGVGATQEVVIGEKTYLTTVEHLDELGTIIVMQDITYVKQLEMERSDFMHALSHDMKSPLTSITGWAQLLEKLQPLDEKGFRYINRIIAATDRMLVMIEQLLQTVDQRDAIQLTQEPCDLVHITERVVNDVQGSALAKSIAIKNCQEGDPYPILADATRMYHMILNLVDNAIKYSPSNTQVDICLHFRATGIAIVVQDDGPGIPEEDLDFVFDKYYRSKKTDFQPGAGLGLSVVRSIAEMHGGQTAVANLPDRGAEFMVTLPGSLRLE